MGACTARFKPPQAFLSSTGTSARRAHTRRHSSGRWSYLRLGQGCIWQPQQTPSHNATAEPASLGAHGLARVTTNQPSAESESSTAAGSFSQVRFTQFSRTTFFNKQRTAKQPAQQPETRPNCSSAGRPPPSGTCQRLRCCIRVIFYVISLSRFAWFSPPVPPERNIDPGPGPAHVSPRTPLIRESPSPPGKLLPQGEADGAGGTPFRSDGLPGG